MSYRNKIRKNMKKMLEFLKKLLKHRLYVVTMYRYGEREKHSYVLGIFTNEEIAKVEAQNEKMYRGCKYYPEILEYRSNNISSRKVILKLEE